MAVRFRKRIRLLPGVTLNISGSGVSTTLGPRGASVNIGKRGTYLNTGLPGTGLYRRDRLDTPAAAPATKPAAARADRQGARLAADTLPAPTRAPPDRHEAGAPRLRWPWFALGLVVGAVAARLV